MPRREDVKIPATQVTDLMIAVSCLIPENCHPPPPVIIMGHGFGAVKAGGLFPFAKRFVESGYAAVMFDYLFFGESDGLPRNLLSISRELQDFRDVIAWVRKQTGKWDTDRVIVWGASFGGMHITALMAEDHDLVAGIMQGPCVDGLAASRQVPVFKTLRLLPLSLFDWMLSLFSSKAIYIPLVGDGKHGSSLAMMSGSEAIDGWKRLTTDLGADFKIHRSRKPLLVVVTTWDNEAPLHKAKQAVRLAPLGEGFRVPGGHFDLCAGGVAFEDNVRRQLQFLRKVLA